MKDDPEKIARASLHQREKMMEQIRILRMGNALLQHALKEVCDELEEVTGKPHGLVELARAILDQEKARWD